MAAFLFGLSFDPLERYVMFAECGDCGQGTRMANFCGIPCRSQTNTLIDANYNASEDYAKPIGLPYTIFLSRYITYCVRVPSRCEDIFRKDVPILPYSGHLIWHFSELSVDDHRHRCTQCIRVSFAQPMRALLPSTTNLVVHTVVSTFVHANSPTLVRGLGATGHIIRWKPR